MAKKPKRLTFFQYEKRRTGANFYTKTNEKVFVPNRILKTVTKKYKG